MGVQPRKNPITREELDAYRKSIKVGDRLIYHECLEKEFGSKHVLKIPMKITGIHRNLITLKAGTRERSMTIQEAMIYNTKRPPYKPKEEPREGTNVRHRRIMELAYRGLNSPMIARKTGYSIAAVNSVLREETRKQKERDKRNKRIVKLRNDGKKIYEIANIVGCSQSTVSDVYKRYLEKLEEK